MVSRFQLKENELLILPTKKLCSEIRSMVNNSSKTNVSNCNCYFYSTYKDNQKESFVGGYGNISDIEIRKSFNETHLLFNYVFDIIKQKHLPIN